MVSDWDRPTRYFVPEGTVTSVTSSMVLTMDMIRSAYEKLRGQDITIIGFDDQGYPVHAPKLEPKGISIYDEDSDEQRT